MTKTGAIDAGIERVTDRLRGREATWMIPILMALFAAGGTIYGMAEESLPFYTLLVPGDDGRPLRPGGRRRDRVAGGRYRYPGFHHQPVRHSDSRQRGRYLLHRRHLAARRHAGAGWLLVGLT